MLALPLAFGGRGLPRLPPLIWNWNEPVGVPPWPLALVTVAAKGIARPMAAGATVDITMVLVEAITRGRE